MDRAGLAENALAVLSIDDGGLVNPASNTARRGAGYGDGEAGPAAPDAKHRADGLVLRGGKGDTWEGGRRVPFLARWPGRIKAGARSEKTISLSDMLATLAAAAGAVLPPEAGPDSFNALPAMLGGGLDDSVRRPGVMRSGGNGMLAIRAGPWKLIDGQGGGGYRDGKALPGEPPQLDRLAQDLGEQTDAYSQHPELARDLRQLLHEIKTQGRSRGSISGDPGLPAGGNECIA